MERKYFKKIKAEKISEGINRLTLSSVYSRNCSSEKYVDVNDDTLEGIKALARQQRRQDTEDYRHLSLYSYDSFEAELLTGSTEDKFILEVVSDELREAMLILSPVMRRRFLRRYLIGMSCADIGRIEGVSRTAVSLSIKQAKIRLRCHLGENYMINRIL